MRVAFVAFFASFLFLAPAQPRASGSMDVQKDFPGVQTPSVSASVFCSAADNGGAVSFRAPGRLKYSGIRLEAQGVLFSGGSRGYSSGVGSASWSGKKTVIAMLASAILPGLGELYCYTGSRDRATLARVPFFFALDGYLWYGYYHNHSKGKDFKKDYMDYADAHWSLNRFLKNHPSCNQGVGDSCDSWQYYNQHCQDQPNYFYYTPREIDTEEYYENIGKYNAFVFGWDDAAAWDYNNPNEFKDFQYWPAHRQYYWSLRKDSDKYLLRAHNYLMGLIVNRIVSMVDAAWIAHRISKGEDPDKGWSLEFKSYNEEPSLIVGCHF